jgi:hypothetical protein
MPASWALLPLRDGCGYASVIGNCRSPFALLGEGRTRNFKVGGAIWSRRGDWESLAFGGVLCLPHVLKL